MFDQLLVIIWLHVFPSIGESTGDSITSLILLFGRFTSPNQLGTSTAPDVLIFGLYNFDMTTLVLKPAEAVPDQSETTIHTALEACEAEPGRCRMGRKFPTISEGL